MSDVILRHVPIRGRIKYFSECLFLTVDKRERIKMTGLGGMPSLYKPRGDKEISACIMAESQLKLVLLVYSLCCSPLFLICIASTALPGCTPQSSVQQILLSSGTEDLVPDANLGSQVLSLSVQRFS